MLAVSIAGLLVLCNGVTEPIKSNIHCIWGFVNPGIQKSGREIRSRMLHYISFLCSHFPLR